MVLNSDELVAGSGTRNLGTSRLFVEVKIRKSCTIFVLHDIVEGRHMTLIRNLGSSRTLGHRQGGFAIDVSKSFQQAGLTRLIRPRDSDDLRIKIDLGIDDPAVALNVGRYEPHSFQLPGTDTM